MKRAGRDIQHYTTLYLVFFAGLIAFVIYSFDRQFQVAVTIALAASYVAWGIVHHRIHGELRWSIVWEYFLVSLLGALLVLSLLAHT